MSDLMLLGILRMPMPEVPNPDEVVAYTQFVLTARQAAARIEELERELAEAKRDAERYRYWRDRHGWTGYFDYGPTNSEAPDDIDAAIDAEMKEGKK